MSQQLSLSKAKQSISELPSQSAIARSFGSAASSYDKHAALQRSVADKLLAMLPATLEKTVVLELGCGTGYCTRQLQQRLPQNLIALDLAFPMLKQLHQSNGSSALLCADAQALPLRAECIDLLVSSLTIQWCFNLHQLFSELQGVLKPGGKAFLSTFGPESLKEVKAAWAQVDAYTHVNSFVAALELQQQAELAGFKCKIMREHRHSYYASLFDLSRELKALGAHNMNRSQAPGLTSLKKFHRAAANFAAGKKDTSKPGSNIEVSWEIYYLMLEKKVS